jgi:DNA-binding SARP family transcriptional activator
MRSDGDQWLTSTTLEINLLGPLDIRFGGSMVQVPQNKHRVVIAVLALHNGTVVTVDELISYLWTDCPPVTAKKTLQGYIARVRRLLGHDAVITHPAGYALASANVDADVFGELLDLAKSESDKRKRLTWLQEALALVRGTPLVDVHSELLRQGVGASLTERWLGAIEQRIDAEISVGDHARVLSELRKLLVTHPFREPFWRQLMYALYRADQQAEALSLYHRVRTMLAAELGVEPSPSVRALHAQILAQDPALMADS